MELSPFAFHLQRQIPRLGVPFVGERHFRDRARGPLAQGEQRFRIAEFVREQPYLACRIQRIEAASEVTPYIEARTLNLRNQVLELLRLIPQAPPELIAGVAAAFSGDAFTLAAGENARALFRLP